MIKSMLFILILTISSYSNENIFFMPKDADDAIKLFIKKIDNSKISIDGTIYSFTNKKISNALKKAASRGVKIRLIGDHESILKDKKHRILELAKLKNIQTYLIKGKRSNSDEYNGKMHLKIMVIDSKIAIYGSANWSQSAFESNYEVLIIDEKKDFIKKFNKNFEEMLQNSKII